jgi:hypothetical protein
MNIQLYNYRLLAHQMERMDKTPAQLAKDAGVSIFSVHAGLAGNLGTLKALRKLADTLGVKWEYITTIDLPASQFHRALIAGKRGVR